MKNNILTTLPNIGKVLAERLNDIGIETIEQFKTIGSENAFIRLLAIDNNACINELLALEGALQGIRWHSLDESKKDELKAFYKMCKLQK